MKPAQYRVFLAALAIAGSLLVWLATSSYGPGLSTDGARYLSTADNLAAGGGLIDYLGLPLVNWPPLYPLLLAGLKLLTGLDVFAVGQALNIIAFGAIIFLSGLFFERILPGSWGFAVIASLIVASSLPLIEVSANIASDPLFLVCVLLFLLTAQRYLADRNRRSWWGMALLAIIGCFLRYAGLALILSGGLVILWAWRREWQRALVEGAAFVTAAGAPIAAFAVLHNLPATGTLLGAHRPSIAGTNFVFLFEKMAGWFLPQSWVGGFIGLLVFAGAVAGLVAASNQPRREAWLARMQSPTLFAAVAFALVYGSVLVFSISTSEHQVAGSQRIHAILLPVFLVLAGSAAQLLPPIRSRGIRNVLFVVFILWLLLPLYRVQAYVRASMEHGDVSYYNLYNTRTLRQSDIVAHLTTLEFSGGERIYSNNEGAAWFYLRRRIWRLPRYDAEAGQTLADALANFDGWPAADENATLVWFERELDYKEMVPTPEEMQPYIRLTPTFTGRHGDVYLMDVE